MVAMARQMMPYEILITDDDPACRETVQEVLAEKGYHTTTASCGGEAIEIARTRLVHVLIVDMNMPDLTGVQTVTIIRREMAIEVPSILMSADNSRELMEQALRAQVESFVPKPVQIGVLRQIVEEIIRRRYEEAS